MTASQPPRKPATKIGSVIFPGDVLTIKEATGRLNKTRIGIGLTPTILTNTNTTSIRKNNKQPEGILCTRAGVLKCKNGKPLKLWIANRQRRYIPYSDDKVIGIITNRNPFFYEVDINGTRNATLGTLEFEGASKRNKPDLKVGDVVFCRVIISNKHMSPILSCKSNAYETNKSWVTNESLFMQLKGGQMITVSLDWCQRLNRIQSPHLIFLGRFFPFEIACGANGRIWMNTHQIAHTLLLSNILQNAQFMNMRDFQLMTHKLLKEYGIQAQ